MTVREEYAIGDDGHDDLKAFPRRLGWVWVWRTYPLSHIAHGYEITVYFNRRMGFSYTFSIYIRQQSQVNLTHCIIAHHLKII
jgi:hypothetical protein